MNLNRDDGRIREEIDHHMAELEAQLRAEGWSEADAGVEAARRFGNQERVRRSTREVQTRGRWVATAEAVRSDVAFAVRQIVRQPLISILTLATLVVGVVATAVVYSVVNAVVIDALPFEEPDRLVSVSQTSPQGRLYGVSDPNFIDFRDGQRSFTDVVAMGYETPVLTIDGQDAEALQGARVSAPFFDVHGVSPILGRSFQPDEDAYGGATDVVILSEGTWRRRFGAAAEVIGRTLVLDGVTRTVVGVVPSGEAWPNLEVFTPVAPNPDGWRDDQRLVAFARLAEGVGLREAQQDLSAIAAQLSEQYPESNDNWGASVRPLREALVGERLTRIGTFLLASVGLFLLMACATVSNLLLARATSRLHEMSVRSALGAGRRRIVGQLLTEGAVFAAVGGVLGLVFARPALSLVKTLGPSSLARLGEASVNGQVLAVSIGAAAFTVLAAGIAPALLLMRHGAADSMRGGARLVSAPGRRLRAGLLIAQYTLAITVLLSAGLLTRSFLALQAVELGFDPDGVVRFDLRLADGSYDQRARAEFVAQVEEELRGFPGVLAVGTTTAAPFGRFAPGNFVARSDQEPDRQQDFLHVSWRAVTEGYFAAAGLQVLGGRVFDERDLRANEEGWQNPPVVIDQALADQLWPDGSNPVGQLVTWFLPGGQQCEVVGVVEVARDENMQGAVRPRIYRPFTFTDWQQPTVVVRTAGDVGQLTAGIRSAVRAFDPSVPAISPGPMSIDVRSAVAWPRFTMQLFTVFGLIALSLAAMGVYGVSAYSVARRHRELGVRMALGAEVTGIHWLVVRESLRLALVGIGAGLVTCLAASRLLESLLYEVSARDPVTFLVVPGALAVVAMLAAWVPARRVLKLDPRSALTSE
jgi:predicted permease